MGCSPVRRYVNYYCLDWFYQKNLITIEVAGGEGEIMICDHINDERLGEGGTQALVNYYSTRIVRYCKGLDHKNLGQALMQNVR